VSENDGAENPQQQFYGPRLAWHALFRAACIVEKTRATWWPAGSKGADVVRKAKVVALKRNITLAQYLTDTIKPLVDKDYAQAVTEMA
jgi:hypothetical protein